MKPPAFVWLFFLNVCLLFLSSSVWADVTRLELVYVSKMPEIESPEGVGGLAELTTLVREMRASREHSMFLHGGDSLAPSALSSFDHGTHMIDLLNDLEPEVYSVNEREFAYKEDQLIMRIEEAAFPFISSNMVDTLTGENLEGVEMSQCFQYGEHKICVLSVIDPAVQETYLPERVHTTDSYAEIKAASSTLRAKGADCIILLTGYEFEEMMLLLEKGEVDLMFLSDHRSDEIKTIEGRLFGRQGTTGGNALKVDLAIEGHGPDIRIKSSGQVVALSDYPKDPEIIEKVDYYLSKLSEIMGVEIAPAQVPLDTIYENVRSKENAFANMVADSFRSYYGVDVGLVNGGSIRGGRRYTKGTVFTRKDIQSELPFRNMSASIAVSGAQLLAAMENGLSRVEDLKGRFLHVSGMEVNYCLDNPAGARVNSIKVGGNILDPVETYTVALTDYLRNGGDGFSMFKDAPPAVIDKNGILTWALVRGYIEHRSGIYSVLEGRLVNACR